MKIRFIDFLMEGLHKIKIHNTPMPYDLSKMKMIGSGVEASVYELDSDPSKVIKVVYLRNLDKPLINLIEIMMNNQDNPHIPRIQEANIYEIEDDYEYKYVLTIIMEKLVPFTDSRISHMLPVFMRQLGLDGDEIINKIKNNIDGGEDVDNIDDLYSLSKPQLDALGEYLDDATFTLPRLQELISSTKNNKLKDALRLIYDFKSNNPRALIDFHDENVMVRLGNPPQLVITDPIV